MPMSVPAAEAALLDRTAASIASPGPSLSGAQRCQVASLVRTFGDDPTIECPSDAPGELVWRLTLEPKTIRAEWLSQLNDAGINAVVYLEVLGIAARLRAVDTFCFALGIAAVAIPEPTDAAPTGAIAGDAMIDGGWVPTVGRASPPNALSMLPSEHDAMHDLHAVFYLSMLDMADLEIDRELHRTQMELVAARTSLLNECFY